MKPHKLIHGLAIAALAYMTVASGVLAWVNMHRVAYHPFDPRLVVPMTVQVWGLMTLLVWRRPRTWGLGVGILLVPTLFFQIFLWIKAVSAPRPPANFSTDPIAFAASEIPLAIAAVCCLLLRWVCPRIPDIPRPAARRNKLAPDSQS